jgi:hypothetical protein
MVTTEAKLARLISARTELEAGVILNGLEERGVRAVMSGIHTANFRAEAPGRVDILVAQEQLVEARAILALVAQERESIDWSQVDVGEPEDAGDAAAVPWWLSLKFWRRVAVTCIVIYCVYMAAAITGLLNPFLRALGRG